MIIYKDWILTHIDSNTSWSDVGVYIKNNLNEFPENNDRKDIEYFFKESPVEDYFLSTWNGYTSYKNSVFKKMDKNNKMISLMESKKKKVEEYQKENKLSSFSQAIDELIHKGLKK